MMHRDVLEAAGLGEAELTGGTLPVHSPIDGAEVARVRQIDPSEMPAVIASALEAFTAWREVPAPRRGELVRLLGEELRRSKQQLGALVTLETGKIISEGLGEVQEMIDICDFAVGLSRQLYGLTMALVHEYRLERMPDFDGAVYATAPLRRTEFGRAQASIRLRTAQPMATSVC